MDHWDELRMFLAVAEGGTVRAAADALDVNHATIIRGIGRLEDRLETKLFDKPSTGYRLTDAGADVVDLARQMSTASSQLEARIFGRDQSVSGPLRLTLPISFATDLLMPTLAAFRAAYPEIALEIIGSGAVANLGNREADVALRVVVGGKSPPDNLYGTRLGAFHTGYYVHRSLLADGASASAAAWLLGADETVPTTWQPGGGLRMASTPIRFAEMRSQFEAARAGMGITHLPCFLGDADPDLVRVPAGPISHVGDIWLLTHADTRQTKRVRLLCDHIRSAMRGLAGRLAGQGQGEGGNVGAG
ncbi:LysR family transcriptional regulator [Aureimonas jatrophae]|uniref:DNA-binding transcriptional regulator, LysR family n=2 Tax=Aureimonas jatrophae TaxID=1166073 RepID=A0A1H0MNA9_9HYPH|nr:LysR family transcriptional regulator [Aureimonas jatrophae]SDO81939.1 DNA-binding transcriptional regulator, LysR family [Aureimonas jatrophae]